MEEEQKDTIIKDLYVDNYFIEEISEKIRLFYVALTRCREKMIIVTSLKISENSHSKLVPYEERIKYRSFLDILNSINVINKYITKKEAQYTHDYQNTKIKNIEKTDNNQKIQKRKINIEYQEKSNYHYSKENKTILSKPEIKAMEYGTKMHEIFEYATEKDNKYLKNILKKLDTNYINIYKEY